MYIDIKFILGLLKIPGGNTMKVAVLDAQGAGLGQTIIKKIHKEIPQDVYVIALGTNTCASSKMVRAGANVGISGEHAICTFCRTNKIDSIIGPIGMLCSGSINGEITPMISSVIFSMDCTKYILPLQKHGIYIPGTRNLQIKDLIEEIVLDIKKSMYSSIP